MTSFLWAAGEPNNRTIFKRLEEQTNVHIGWTAIGPTGGAMNHPEYVQPQHLTDFVFTADFTDGNLLRYADQGVILNLKTTLTTICLISRRSLSSTPEACTMHRHRWPHIWHCPGSSSLAEKTAIQTIGNMSFINTKRLNFLGLSMPTTDEFEQVLIAFRDNAASIKAEWH